MDARKAHPSGRGVRWAAWALAAVLLSVLPVAAVAAERVALVIGNAAYEHVPDLVNPKKDAADVGAALARLGFAVTHLKNAGKQDLDRGLQKFEEEAARSKIAVVFYAGHGIEVDKHNYLVPVGARLATDRAVRWETIPLDDVMAAVEGASTLGLVILDACRDNPFLANMQSTGLKRLVGRRGLARVELPEPQGTGKSMLVAYSAQEGMTAADGVPGGNSPYAEALLKHLETPGLHVGDLFIAVRQEVLAKPGSQRPVEYASLVEKVYLASAGAPLPKVPATPTAGGASPVQTPSGDAARAYEAAERLNTVAAYRIVVEDFPGTTYAKLAQEWIDKHAQEPGDTFRDCPECPEMVVVPAGSFRMGSPPSEAGRRDAEGPVHRVTIAEPFAVGVHEVTRGEFARFVEATGRSMGSACWTYEGGEWKERSGHHWRHPGFGQTDAHPVVCVDWNDAKAYVRWLSGETGKAYRLLSESEWEYVARAGTETARYWGESESGQCRYANGADASTDFNWRTGCNDGHARTAPVGSFGTNGFGLHDMLGNVWEWVADCWNDSYAGAPSDGSAWTSGECVRRVLRGGSWNYFPWLLRAANRIRSVTGIRDNVIGFRVARTLVR